MHKRCPGHSVYRCFRSIISAIFPHASDPAFYSFHESNLVVSASFFMIRAAALYSLHFAVRAGRCWRRFSCTGEPCCLACILRPAQSRLGWFLCELSCADQLRCMSCILQCSRLGPGVNFHAPTSRAAWLAFHSTRESRLALSATVSLAEHAGEGGLKDADLQNQISYFHKVLELIILGV